jgi:hypothetical protein
LACGQQIAVRCFEATSGAHNDSPGATETRRAVAVPAARAPRPGVPAVDRASLRAQHLVGESVLAAVLAVFSIIVVKDRLPVLPGFLFVSICTLLVLVPDRRRRDIYVCNELQPVWLECN